MPISPVFNQNKTQMILKLESTMGTPASLLAADNDIKWIPDSIQFDPEIEEFLFWFASGRHSQGQATMGKKKAMLKAQAPLLPSAALGTAPKIGKALKACGQAETVVASTSVAYGPDATKDQGDGINCTIGVIYVPTTGNAIMATMKGAMGNVKYGMSQGGFPIIADFDFIGAFVGITDGSSLALTSPDSGYAPGTIGSVITMASIAQQIAKMELDAGNVLEFDEDNADPSSTGYGAAYIAKRDPKLHMDPKARLLAVDPAFTRWAAGTQAAFSMTTAVEAGQKFTLAAPKTQLSGMKFGKRGSSLTWDSTYLVQENAGNDEFSLLLSA